MAESSATQTSSRTDAASMIAELWEEREQGRSSPSESRPSPAQSPQAQSRPPKPPKPPRREADGRQRALATVIVLLLLAGLLGVVGKTLGLIGAPSKADFVAEADAVCASTNASVNSLSKPIAYPAVATSASALVSTTDTQLDRLGDLDLPGGADRDRARAVFTAMATTRDAGRSLQTAAGASDAATTAGASRSLSATSQDALAKASGYGFTACVVGMKTGVDALIAGANGVVKDSYLVAGSRLCVDFLRSIEAVPTIRNANDLTRFVNQNTALVDTLVTDLRALPVPPGDEATVTEMIAAVERLSGKLKQMGVAGTSGDLRRLSVLEDELDTVGDEVNAKFENYGLRTCGSTD